MAKEENRDFGEDIVDMLEPQIFEKYSISLKQLLADPLAIEDKDNAAGKIPAIKEDIDNYMNKLNSQSSESQETLDKSLQNANNISIQLKELITTVAREKQIPVLNATFGRNIKKDEVISIENFDENVTLLVNKLISTSLFVVNESYRYREYEIGAWVFSSNKDYALQVFMPPHEIMIIDSAKSELDGLLDQALSILSSKA